MSGDIQWLIFCAALAGGEAVGFACARYGACWPVVAVIAVLSALFGYGLRVRGWPWLCVFLLGMTLALAAAALRADILESAFQRNNGRPYTAVATISGSSRCVEMSDGSRRVAVSARVGPVKVRLHFTAAPDQALPRRGERWLCSGWLLREARAVRPYWISGRETFVRPLPPSPADRISCALGRLHDELFRRIGIGLEDDDEGAALNRAILLGAREGLPAALKTDFVSAGTVHVFAISGLHVMFVAAFFRLLLVFCGVPLRTCGLLLVPVLWLYACLTGFPPSAVRAALMITFYCLAPLFWRRPDALSAWAATFLTIHTLSPESLLDTGCRLSFGVMFALVAWSRWGVPLQSRAGRLASVTLVAWAASVPIAAAAFERLTPAGLLANPLLVPLAGAGVTAGVTGCLASCLSEGLARYLNNFAALCSHVMSGFSSLVSRLPGASFEVAAWTPVMCIGWYAACVLAVLLVRSVSHRRRTVL